MATTTTALVPEGVSAIAKEAYITCSAFSLIRFDSGIKDRCSRRRNCTRTPMLIGDCARTVHESNVFIALSLASSEKQIPQIVENIGKQNSGRS